jgi:hypothetical protein
MKKLKPKLTEKEFAMIYENEYGYDRWDEDLVDLRLYDGSTDCLDVFTKYETIGAGKSYVYLTLLAIDIPQNLEYIKTI